MAATATYKYYQTVDRVITKTTDGDPVIHDELIENIASTAAVTVLDGGSFIVRLGATATNTVSIWPNGIAALDAGTAIHICAVLTAGSTDTTAASRKVSATSGDAKVSVLFSYAGQPTNLGRAFEFDFSAVTTLVLERINTANEKIQVEVIWYIYTI